MFKEIRSYIKVLLRNIQGHLTPTSIGSIGPHSGEFQQMISPPLLAQEGDHMILGLRFVAAKFFREKLPTLTLVWLIA